VVKIKTLGQWIFFFTGKVFLIKNVIFFINKDEKVYNNTMSIIRTRFPLFGHLFVFVFDT
jgi:hypothetical protein